MAEQLLAVVTGAGRGIGLEVAKQLAKEGYRVIAVDREQKLLGALPNTVEPLNADIGTPAGQLAVKEKIRDDPLHVLAHIAHAYKIAPLMEMDLASQRDIQRTNIEAPIFLTQVLLENIKAAKGECRMILCGAPVGDAYKPIPSAGSLFMTKVAIRYLANVLRVEMKGIAQIGYVEPGMTKTPFVEGLVNEKGPLAAMATKRIAEGKFYTQETTAEWIMALLQQPKDTFEISKHQEDNPSQSYGVTFPDTPERQGKWEYTEEVATKK